MRESRPYGSVRGDQGNLVPYRDQLGSMRSWISPGCDARGPVLSATYLRLATSCHPERLLTSPAD